MLGAATLFLLVAVSFSKELMRSYQIKKEIERLQEDIASLHGKNKEMSDFVEYLKTDAYFEQQARLKLGLKAEGEKLLVLTDTPEVVEPSDDPSYRSPGTREQPQGVSQGSNPAKWFHYFFGG
jgi:hypothetical protein